MFNIGVGVVGGFVNQDWNPEAIKENIDIFYLVAIKTICVAINKIKSKDKQ